MAQGPGAARCHGRLDGGEVKNIAMLVVEMEGLDGIDKIIP